MFYEGKIANPINLQQISYNIAKELKTKTNGVHIYQLVSSCEVLATFLVIQKQACHCYVSYDHMNTFIGHGVAMGGGYDKVSFSIIKAITNSIETAKSINQLDSISAAIQVFAFRYLQDLSAGVNFGYTAKEAGYHFNQIL